MPELTSYRPSLHLSDCNHIIGLDTSIVHFLLLGTTKSLVVYFLANFVTTALFVLKCFICFGWVHALFANLWINHEYEYRGHYRTIVLLLGHHEWNKFSRNFYSIHHGCLFMVKYQWKYYIPTNRYISAYFSGYTFNNCCGQKLNSNLGCNVKHCPIAKKV